MLLKVEKSDRKISFGLRGRMFMKKKKASIFILSVAMTVSLILGGILSVSASVSEEQNSTDPVIFYDFESGNMSGSTVKNTGSKANSDAKLVTGDGGISVSQGKLVFDQEKSASANESKNLGHLRLPDDMFADVQTFTFVIDVYDLYIRITVADFCPFLPKILRNTVTEAGSKTTE